MSVTDTIVKKKRINKKILLGASSLLITAIFIGICSFVPFLIDPSGWQTVDFLTNELIIVAIVIFSMVSTIFMGQASNAQSEESNIAKARSKFFVSLAKITNINSFNQWVKKKLQPNDIRDIRIRMLRQAGVDDVSVLDLEIHEIKALQDTPQKYGDRYYKGLTEKQVKDVLKAKTGKLNIQFVEPSYYLSVKNLVDSRTITERSSTEGKKKGLYLTMNIVSRVVLTVITAMIFASFARDLTKEMDVADASAKFVSRLWSMISSSFMGFITGCQMNDIDAEYINMRIVVHEMFLKDDEFKPMSEQEEARQEYIERVKAENVLKIESKR